eukprot:CAMPEP_0206620736 /NCGR_PEP_ID=MMETSP0325_2-20121206/61797_1 /ASSEMBLY_ACC=CAM_ASM_000347 /TAXON_ID=2866 /ORGANISM="Crypthecodinium cohnii, Strain Seligo" /LENGTH=58 /DNA_ID=CAMNT_0054143745 /DNA_START=36 /DNA_END=209 /DNA_ORIENTATION=+
MTNPAFLLVVLLFGLSPAPGDCEAAFLGSVDLLDLANGIAFQKLKEFEGQKEEKKEEE